MSETAFTPAYPVADRHHLDDPEYVWGLATTFVKVWDALEGASAEYRWKKYGNRAPTMDEELSDAFGPGDDEFDGVAPKLVQQWRDWSRVWALFLADYARRRGLDDRPLAKFAEFPDITRDGVIAAVKSIRIEARRHAVEVPLRPAKPKKRGRKQEYDPATDRKLAEGWQSYRSATRGTMEEYAREKGIARAEIRDAVERDRHRPDRRKNSEA